MLLGQKHSFISKSSKINAQCKRLLFIIFIVARQKVCELNHVATLYDNQLHLSKLDGVYFETSFNNLFTVVIVMIAHQ